jgi:hypothetical protein
MKSIAETTRCTIRYSSHIGEDGSRRMYVLPKDGEALQCIGRLMPTINQATAEASPGIQSWSHPRSKGGPGTKLQDGGASVLNFSTYWERHWQRSYPLHRDMGVRDER